LGCVDISGIFTINFSPKPHPSHRNNLPLISPVLPCEVTARPYWQPKDTTLFIRSNGLAKFILTFLIFIRVIDSHVYSAQHSPEGFPTIKSIIIKVTTQRKVPHMVTKC